MGKRKGSKNVRKSVPYPTSTSLGDHLIIAYNIEQENHQDLQQQIRVQQMEELMITVKGGGVYRSGKDTSPQLKKMIEMLKYKGTQLRKMRYIVNNMGRF